MRFLMTAALSAVLMLTAAVQAQELPIDIPFESFTLDNGLTVIVHEDRKAPIVAVNIWYHVGSKNERPGITGFAHLFEHLMFNGSENFDDDYFQVLEKVGATDLNGTTWFDRTNYFQNVPTSALDLALWMESDRMGHLLGAITQEKLDEQRGVVQNEKRQGENEPYGLVSSTISENTYPEGHPYSWSTIGSMDDLNAASVDDVKEWFSTYYGAANAVLVLVGDIDVATAKEKVQKYFGDVDPGPPVLKQDAWVAKMSGEHRMLMEDRVPQARVYMRWNVPEWGSDEAWYLDMVSDVLARGKNSRLYKRLVYEDQIATDASAFLNPFEIGSQFGMQASARPGVELADIETALWEELHRFLQDGPTDAELERVKSQIINSFIRSAETIGGFGGKSDILAESFVYGGSPDAWADRLRLVQSATAEDLLEAAREWLSDGVFVLEVHPFGDFAAGEGIDRSEMPSAGTPPSASFPALQRAELSNGLKVVLAERHTAPIVNFNLMVDAGYASDQFGKPGTAQLAMAMLDEGTDSRTALEIADEAALLGAAIGAGSNLDRSSVSLSALKRNLEASLDLYADIVLNPAFPEADFERLKQQQLVGIQREQATPIQMALRVFPGLMYGDDHAYGLPFTGSGFTETVQSLTREDLSDFHDTWVRPNNATMVVSGDITMDELVPLLESKFENWGSGRVPAKNVARVDYRNGGKVYLMDRPGSMQSVILAGHVAPPKANPDELAIQTMNNVLGGAFISRVNMNLREDKGWAYGASTIVIDAVGQRPFVVYAPVQTDKTAESMAEIVFELEAVVGDRPIQAEEMAWSKDTQTLTLAGQWETIGAVGGSVSEIIRFGLPDDHYQGYAQRINDLSLSEVQGAAPKLVSPSNLVWIIVGDGAVIQPRMEELGFTDIVKIDSNGRPQVGGTD
ncbi:MAG: insulinase family protein [Rhodothermales bacterium]|nr:insulinase family protein [Rhodothermales bacterium]